MPSNQRPSTAPMQTQTTRPDPDPTVLTTQALFREIGLARELVEAQIGGIRQVFETRLDGMDKAIELLQTRSDKLPASIDNSVNQLQQLHGEKFASIETQFLERDTRTEQTSRDSKVAVDAALQAAKEAVGEQNKSNALAISKSEAAFTKQIDQIGVLVNSMSKAIDDKIDDIKGRLQAMESQKKGGSDVWAIVLAIGGALIGIAGVAVAAVAIISSRHQ